MRPVIPGRARGDVQQFGGFVDGQAGEIPQLDQLGLDGVLRRELIEGLIDREQLIVGVWRGEIDLLDIHPLLSAPVTEGAFAAGPVNADAAPGLSGGGYDMGAAGGTGVY